MALKIYQKNEQTEQAEQAEADTLKSAENAEVKAKADLSELEQSSKGSERKARSKERAVTTTMLMEILKTAQGRTLSTVVLTVVAVAALILFAIAPALATITAQVDKNQALQEKIQKMSDKYNALNTLKTKQDSNETALTNFDNYFAVYSSKNIQGKMQKEIYTELSDLITQNNFAFTTITFSDGTAGLKNYKDLTLNDRLKFQAVKLTITGNKADLPGLLTAIESQKRIYQVENVSITTLKESAAADQINLSLNTIFWQLPT